MNPSRDDDFEQWCKEQMKTIPPSQWNIAPRLLRIGWNGRKEFDSKSGQKVRKSKRRSIEDALLQYKLALKTNDMDKIKMFINAGNERLDFLLGENDKACCETSV